MARNPQTASAARTAKQKRKTEREIGKRRHKAGGKKFLRNLLGRKPRRY